MLMTAQRSTGYAAPSVRGLQDTFSSSAQYVVTQNILDMQADSSLVDRVSAIVMSGVQGTYQNYPVYNDAATGKIYVDVGLSYPRLQEIVSTTQSLIDPPGGGSDCPCDSSNCREEIVQETWWASPNKSSDSDIEVDMSREVTICEPVEQSPTLACADELAKIKAANGINGLRGLRGLGNVQSFTDKQKRCMDGCKGLPLPQWNLCMDKCTVPNNPIETQATAWKDCYNACNSKRLSQAELSRCYAGCGTGTAISPAGQLVASNSPFGLVETQSLPRMKFGINGLSNDDSTVIDEGTYVTDPAVILSQPIDCEKNNSRGLWFVVIGAAGVVLGILLSLAWKKR